MSETNTIKQNFIETSDAKESREFLVAKVAELTEKLEALPSVVAPTERAKVLLDLANAELGMTQMSEVWNHAKAAFDLCIAHEEWQLAVEACDLLYQTELPSSIIALGHGVWLSVTYPLEPEYSINMLNYVINETTDDADGAALAAITAHFIVDHRSSGKQLVDLKVLTTNMLAKVALRHSKVETQVGLDVWMDKMELRDPDVFLPRMGMVVGAIVGDGNWWFDRKELQAKIA
ncbi:MAG: hypothetical protein KZQ83_12325 [gamma proteobacterium symbiont of Taylorina sp.]|nr:hypothetical protein [gamma proteobacterium symbiont of Taylorina sp.]